VTADPADDLGLKERGALGGRGARISRRGSRRSGASPAVDGETVADRMIRPPEQRLAC
jgi:hypothetical protein